MKNFAQLRFVVTGGAGFLGTEVIKELKKAGVETKNIFVPRSVEFDLTTQAACEAVASRGDVIIHLAANVGGIGYNRKFPGKLFYDNAAMGLHMLEAARKAKIKKFVSIGTVCAYPKFTPVPFKEEDLWNGYPEETNAPYGIAKKMLLVQGLAYRTQYKMNVIYLLPVNLYGPEDNFNPESSHVIPALIQKFVEGKLKNHAKTSIWGTGNATREFLYVADAARGIVLATQKYDGDQPINLGSGLEISIYELAHVIAELVGYSGKIVFDANKLDGQPKRLLDTTKAKKEFGFEAKTNFRTGLKKTIDWYLKQI